MIFSKIGPLIGVFSQKEKFAAAGESRHAQASTDFFEIGARCGHRRSVATSRVANNKRKTKKGCAGQRCAVGTALL